VAGQYFFNGGKPGRWRNTNDELVPGSFIFVPGFRNKNYQSKTKRGQMAQFLNKY
jgi:hypothetical protein